MARFLLAWDLAGYALGIIAALAASRAEINQCRAAHGPNCDLAVLQAVFWPVTLATAWQREDAP